jgi:hypothetical protein
MQVKSNWIFLIFIAPSAQELGGFFMQKNPLATQKLHQRPGPFGIHYFRRLKNPRLVRCFAVRLRQGYAGQVAKRGEVYPERTCESKGTHRCRLSACFATSLHQQPQRRPKCYTNYNFFSVRFDPSTGSG